MNALLVTLSISYELTTDAREHLGADALSIWSRALETECQRSFPGVDVNVTSRWTNIDVSRYDIVGETIDDHAIAGNKEHTGSVEVYNYDEAYMSPAMLRVIADGLIIAEREAWDRACDLV